ncbi:rhodanese-like domain-containing protein [Gloeobacter violaceus]|uniref:Gll1087 protein n=1 Tax=Gloeobacter violaceus (strain ATCC 29082 / PCC 7421) TaxID=251221 RepID=Q7NLN4_GLOVI|nr:rhodanese-like domain-containing protein [Gloeobacter violaceus]BAC89028.1 gll1087 [Gloeobacter violaceus PCC 7421]
MASEATTVRAPHRTTVEVQAKAELLYSLWKQFECSPLFFHHVKSVELDPTNCHIQRWSGDIGGTAQEWTVYITELEPNRRIAWRSVQSDFENSGSVTFEPSPAGEATRLTVEMFFELPTALETDGPEALQETFAAHLAEDLSRLGPMVETLEARLDSHRLAGEPLDAALTRLLRSEAGWPERLAKGNGNDPAAVFEASGVFVHAGARHIDASALLALLQSGNPLLLIDVRFSSDYEQGHIEGAANASLDRLELFVYEQFEQMESTLELPVVLYSDLDGIAARGTLILQEAGYFPVLEYAGGFTEWEAMGLPVCRYAEEEAEESPQVGTSEPPAPAEFPTASGPEPAAAFELLAASATLLAEPDQTPFNPWTPSAEEHLPPGGEEHFGAQADEMLAFADLSSAEVQMPMDDEEDEDAPF